MRAYIFSTIPDLLMPKHKKAPSHFWEGAFLLDLYIIEQGFVDSELADLE